MTAARPIEAYPLAWPVGWPRAGERKRATFAKRGPATEHGWRPIQRLTIADGVQRVRRQLEQLGAEDVVISTNVPLRRDALPDPDECFLPERLRRAATAPLNCRTGRRPTA